MDKNILGLTDLTAFGFVPFVCHVHYHPVIEKEFLLANKHGRMIYAIPDGCAVEVNDEKITIHGDVDIC